MLGSWRSHEEYQTFVRSSLRAYAILNPAALLEYQTEIEKLYILDLDPLKAIIAPLYSMTGRPSNFQPEIFRALVLMNALHLSPDQWTTKVRNNPLLRIICGFPDNESLPAVASYYDFIHRIYALDEKPVFRNPKHKPKKKLKKGEKLPPKHPNIVAKLVERILAGRRFGRRPELVLQQIFARLSVDASLHIGLLSESLSVSGDGTCIETGASPFGRKTCECRKNGVYNCDCPRKFSDPGAAWGWDSHNERYFYGYTGYFISTYNKALKLDLPIYLRLVSASRHDSISAVISIAEFRDLHPDLSIDTFIHDSAADNYATYHLLNAWDINAVIALNLKRGPAFKYPQHLSLDGNGAPVCPADRR